MTNPFDVTRAVDFDDHQINDYWVDLPGGAGFKELVKPTSPMSMVILGGKGSGKTHLLRYFSAQLQRLRHPDPWQGILADGHVGIYLRCGGLNASRFGRKRQTDEVWSGVFQYYMDLWLTQLYLDVVLGLMPAALVRGVEADICRDCLDLFDSDLGSRPGTLGAFRENLRDWQRSLDAAINNAAISGALDVSIRTSPGRLVFGLPRVFAKRIPDMERVQAVYLIDELENLSQSQQRYVNTLLREREGPTSFRIGARLYGMKTYETYSAGEINREGSEYEKLLLDDHLRENRAYPQFAALLCMRRLKRAGYVAGDLSGETPTSKRLMKDAFETPGDPLAVTEGFDVAARSRRSGKPHLSKVAGKLDEGVRRGLAPGVDRVNQIPGVVSLLEVDGNPLLEKMNALLFFQAWSEGDDLILASERIAKQCARFLADPASEKHYREKVAHFRSDMAAQLLRECDLKQQYLGFDTFVAMSRGVPRSLLVSLKHVFQWALFNGEQPFRGTPVSIGSQQQGVMEAARWFFRDAEVLGDDGRVVQDAIRRLCDLLRGIRFSDKPSECSLSTFSVNLAQLPERSRDLIELAEKWSLLIRIGKGQRDRNTRRATAKFQLNSMLAPLWDLPIARRGALALSAREVCAIFNPANDDEFRAVVHERVARMTAPAFRADGGRRSPSLPLLS